MRPNDGISSDIRNARGQSVVLLNKKFDLLAKNDTGESEISSQDQKRSSSTEKDPNAFHSGYFP